MKGSKKVQTATAMKVGYVGKKDPMRDKAMAHVGKALTGSKESGCVKKMAMGGVGKIRHKEATSTGVPIKMAKRKAK
jgi:hypothetical protein